MHAMVVVVSHKLAELLLQLPGQIIVIQIDDVFHGAVIALDLALGYSVIGSAINKKRTFD